MKSIFDSLNASKETTIVRINSDGKTYYVDGVINWGPTSATCILNDLGNLTGQAQSPALQLGHEAAHANGGLWAAIRAGLPSGMYHTMEEKHVTRGVETDAAKTLREPTRTNHGGMGGKVSSPTSRSCQCKR